MLAEIVNGDLLTFGFRGLTIAGLLTALTFMWKLLGAVKNRGAQEQRIDNHLKQTDPLIDQFRAMQSAVATSAERHTALVERLDRHITMQDEANRTFRDSIDRLMRRPTAGAS